MRLAVRFVFRLLEAAALILAIGMLVLICVQISSSAVIALDTASIALQITQELPAWLALWGVMSTPFGGVFRTDFAIIAFVLIIIASIFKRIAKVVS